MNWIQEVCKVKDIKITRYIQVARFWFLHHTVCELNKEIKECIALGGRECVKFYTVSMQLRVYLHTYCTRRFQNLPTLGRGSATAPTTLVSLSSLASTWLLPRGWRVRARQKRRDNHIRSQSNRNHIRREQYVHQHWSVAS